MPKLKETNDPIIAARRQKMREYMRKYLNDPLHPERYAKVKERNREYNKAYRIRPDVLEYRRAQAREYARKKREQQLAQQSKDLNNVQQISEVKPC